MKYFSSSDSGNGSVVAITWDGGKLFERLMRVFTEDMPQGILLDPLVSENMDIATKQNMHFCDAVIPADEAGEAELLRYSLPRLSSLRPASATLKSLLPGLQETSRKAVPLISYSDLISLTKALSNPLRLVINTPGSELDILKGIEQAGLLKNVAAIHLSCGTEAFFMQASNSEEILSWLNERFFRIFEKNEDDVDWPEFLLLRDFSAERIEELTAALKTVSEDRDKALMAQEALTKREAELKDSQNRVETLRKEMSRLREDLATAEEYIARSKTDRDHARKDLGVALNNAAGLRQDYCDLRDRYAFLLNEKGNLEQLIQQLTPRLQEAAEHLRHFSSPSWEKAALKQPQKAKSVRQKPEKRSSGK